MSTTTARMTVDEFLKLPEVEGEKKELIRGEVADVPRSDEPAHEHAKANLSAILVLWLHQHRYGRVFVGSPYLLDDYNCLAPDISVLGSERLRRGIDELFRGAPHLAIEVVSREAASRLRTKIRLHLKHGSESVWVVYPEERIIEVHRANGRIVTFEQEQILEDLDALPGFGTPVAAIFEGL